jgi:hypothetical protein
MALDSRDPRYSDYSIYSATSLVHNLFKRRLFQSHPTDRPGLEDNSLLSLGNLAIHVVDAVITGRITYSPPSSCSGE